MGIRGVATHDYVGQGFYRKISHDFHWRIREFCMTVCKTREYSITPLQVNIVGP